MTEGRVLEGFHITAGGGGEGRGVKDSSGYSNFFERRERGRQENPCLRLAMDEHISLLNIQSNSQISPWDKHRPIRAIHRKCNSLVWSSAPSQVSWAAAPPISALVAVEALSSKYPVKALSSK